MTWRTFFDAVIMAEVKRRLLRLPKVSHVLPQIYATGRVVHGAVVACARAVRGTERGRVIFRCGRRSFRYPRRGRELADDSTAASARLPPPLLSAHFWPYRLSRPLSRLTGP
jgi:hypothetical protein